MDNWTVHNILPAGLPAPIEPDRGGYTLTMRESMGAEDVLERLGGSAPGGQRVHVGWGSFRNLDIAATRQSSWVLLLDINFHQFRVWEGVSTALNDDTSSDPESFVAAVVPRLPHQPRLRQFSPSTQDWLLGDLDRPGSWLYKKQPGRFQWIRRLFREGRVATGCVDLRAAPGCGIFTGMAENIERAAVRGIADFDTLYVSNLPWMLAQHEGFFGESHAAFTPPEKGGVLDQTRQNLQAIAPRFRHVVSAAQLAETSQENDLQWRTELLVPEAFLDPAYWSVLKPVSGPFRRL